MVWFIGGSLFTYEVDAVVYWWWFIYLWGLWCGLLVVVYLPMRSMVRFIGGGLFTYEVHGAVYLGLFIQLLPTPCCRQTLCNSQPSATTKKSEINVNVLQLKRYVFMVTYMSGNQEWDIVRQTNNLNITIKDELTPLADPRRGAREAPLWVMFMQFLEKIGQIIGWRPPLGVGAPSSGKSWICHCHTALMLPVLTW